MSASMKHAIDLAKSENRRELVLTGAEVAKEIEEDGLEAAIYSLKSLNFLEVSKCGLQILTRDVANLSGLTNLVLHSNKLEELPTAICRLTKLKLLDISNNRIEELPETFFTLTELQTLLAGNNLLSSLPDGIEALEHLTTLNLSHNEFSDFPVIVCSMKGLMTLNLSDNKIVDISPDVEGLHSLKLLDLSNNLIKVIPAEVADCPKLKDLNMTGNKLSDKRLEKLFIQLKTKAALEYVRKNSPRSKSGDSTTKKTGSGKDEKRKKKREKKDEDKAESTPKHTVKVEHCQDSTTSVLMTEAIRDVRPFIICCIMKNVDLSKRNTFKKFISLQTKLHDSVCDKRSGATIATHDLALMKGNLVFDAKPPDTINILPLFQHHQITAKQLYSKLRDEAEALRKEKKRNTFSGIHKYLYLLQGKTEFAFLMDGEERVISLPPLVNSDVTKISHNTKDIFIEVTSTKDMQICKKVMEALILEMLNNNVWSDVDANDEPSEASQQMGTLVIEQVRVIDANEHLKVVYPSRTDLQLETLQIVRDY